MPQLHVAAKVHENRFRIAGGVPRGEICWQVSGVRNDRYMRTHGIKVEVDKPLHERGKYQHPELYGKPAEMAVHYRPRADKAVSPASP